MSPVIDTQHGRFLVAEGKVEWETDYGWHARLETPGGGSRNCFLPNAHVRADALERDIGGNVHRAAFTVPLWLAKKKGLA